MSFVLLANFSVKVKDDFCGSSATNGWLSSLQSWAPPDLSSAVARSSLWPRSKSVKSIEVWKI